MVVWEYAPYHHHSFPFSPACWEALPAPFVPQYLVVPPPLSYPSSRTFHLQVVIDSESQPNAFALSVCVSLIRSSYRPFVNIGPYGASGPFHSFTFSSHDTRARHSHSHFHSHHRLSLSTPAPAWLFRFTPKVPASLNLIR